MKRLAFAILICFCACAAAHGQREDIDTTVVETGYYVTPSYGGKYKVIVAIVAANPYEDKFASRPNVRVTARSADGAVISTQDVDSAGIPPKGRIAFVKSFYADEMPAKVDFRPLSAGYEPTIYRAAEFLPFTLSGVRPRPDGPRRIKVTGEVKNPYPNGTGVWITVLYRDEAGKLLGGHMDYESDIPAGAPSPFEFYVDIDEIPPGAKKIEEHVFCHNNYQDSWKKLLRR